MNQKLKTIILWALPIILVIALSYQFLSTSNIDSLKSNGTTIAPKNSADILKVTKKYLRKPFLSIYGEEKICNKINKLWIKNF